MSRLAQTIPAGAFVLAVILLVGCVAAPDKVQPSSATNNPSQLEVERARDVIWAKELAIYSARGNGDLDTYIANTSTRYMGWPPGWDQPSGVEQLKAGAAQMKGQSGEKLTMDLTGFTLSGDTGVIYYRTHRTQLPGGAPTNQWFHVIHVWTREQGEWKLIGALGRDGTPAQSPQQQGDAK